MPSLPDEPALADFQKYVVYLERERGFADENVFQKCLLLGEEVGELSKRSEKTRAWLQTTKVR